MRKADGLAVLSVEEIPGDVCTSASIKAEARGTVRVHAEIIGSTTGKCSAPVQSLMEDSTASVNNALTCCVVQAIQ